MISKKRLFGYLATGVMPEMTALDESLAEHDKKYHPDGYKEGDECNKRAGMAGGDWVDVDVEGKNKDNGNSMILFHGGTDNERPWDGMWLTDNEKYAEGFGDVKRYAVRLGKVFDAGNIESNDIERWISSVENRLGIGKEDLKKQASGYEYPSQIINNGLLDSYLVKNGYDSISCIEGNGNARSYMVLDSENISLASEGETNKRRIGVTAEEDAAYLDAVNRGDTETCAKMVREAAARAMPDTKAVDEDGKPQIVYHGTDEDFTVFDTEKVGEKFDWVDVDHNFFFTASNRMASGYGVNVMQVFLNIRRPEIRRVNMDIGSTQREIHEELINAHDLGDAGYTEYEKDEEHSDGAIFYAALRNESDIKKNVSARKEIKDLEEKYNKAIEEKDNITVPLYHDLEQKLLEIATKQYTDYGPRWKAKPGVNEKEFERLKTDINSVEDKIKKCLDTEKEVQKEIGDIIKKAIRSSNFKKDYSCTLYNCDNPSQIKSADPVTYDDAGQPIPLSRRFDFSSDDIRY